MTNLEKFEEVFGFQVETLHAVCPKNFNCENLSCTDCKFNAYWWKSSYKLEENREDEHKA